MAKQLDDLLTQKDTLVDTLYQLKGFDYDVWSDKSFICLEAKTRRQGEALKGMVQDTFGVSALELLELIEVAAY
jgi:hypothetical protein